VKASPGGASDVVVVGGGLIGLAVAWRAARDGMSVAVCDPAIGQGASWAAAGMLGTTTEARWGEGPLHALLRASAVAWPEFAAELEAESGLEVGLRRDGMLTVALDADDHRALLEALDVQRRLGGEAEELSGRDCRALEPSLSPRAVAGLLHPGDHQVDNRLVVRALRAVLVRRGVRLCPQAVRQLRISPAHGVHQAVLESGEALPGGRFVLAAGCHSAQVGGLPPEDVPPVRPVKGQILRLRSPGRQVLARTVRVPYQGRDIYIVPRATGEIVVGATVEEAGFDTTVTAGAVFDLLRRAVTAVPELAEVELSEAIARLRPGSPDNGPILGPAVTPGLLLATGHFRHGVLLTPVTAEALGDALAGRPVSGPAAAFCSARFRDGALCHG